MVIDANWTDHSDFTLEGEKIDEVTDFIYFIHL